MKSGRGPLFFLSLVNVSIWFVLKLMFKPRRRIEISVRACDKILKLHLGLKQTGRRAKGGNKNIHARASICTKLTFNVERKKLNATKH